MHNKDEVVDLKKENKPMFLSALPLVFCIEMNSMWFVDSTLGGLFKMDLSSYVIEEILDADELFADGFFRPVSMFFFEEDIWIVPDNLANGIIVCNITDGKTRHTEETKIDINVNGAISKGEDIYIFPLSDIGILFRLNIKNDTCVKIEVRNHVIEENANIWEWCRQNKYIYIPRSMANGVIRIDTEDNSAIVILEDISATSMVALENELWILPNKESEIYLYNANLERISKIPINGKCDRFNTDLFSRIAAMSNSIILLPMDDRTPLLMYLKNEREWKYIEAMPLNMVIDFERLWVGAPSYYPYYININGDIEILPLKKNWLYISRTNESVQYRYIDFADYIDKSRIKELLAKASKFRGKGIYTEKDDSSLEKLIKLIVDE